MAENKTIALPDVGDFQDIEIIEILIAVGDEVQAEQSIIVLESDKATMEIPSPYSGTIESITVAVGDRLNEGDQIATISTSDAVQAPADSSPAAVAEAESPAAEVEPVAESPAEEVATAVQEVESAKSQGNLTPGKTLRPHPGAEASPAASGSSKTIHASPSIRRYARELGVDLEQVIGSGPKGRIVKADVKAFVKSTMSGGNNTGGSWYSASAVCPKSIIPDSVKLKPLH